MRRGNLAFLSRPRLIIPALVAAALLASPPARAQDSRPETAPAKIFGPAARWIWDGGDDKPVDAYRLFRKTFHVETARNAVVRVTADAEYRLWVNDDLVARGPAPSPAGRSSVDEVAVRFHPGTNAIAVLVSHPGVPTFARVLGRAGLIAEASAGGVPLVSTDASWRWSGAWWLPTGQRISPFREFVEHLDARRKPQGFARADFDDSAWKAAAEIGVGGTAPSTTLEMRDIEMPASRGIARPAALLFVRTCSNEVPPVLESAKLLAAAPSDSRSADDLVKVPKRPWPRGACPDLDVRSGTVVGLDFGEEVSGFPTLVAEAEQDGVVVDLGYGEALEDGGRVSVLRQNMPHMDRMTLRKGRQELTVFHPRAFRYAVAAVRGGDARLQLGVEQSGFPVNGAGHDDGAFFSCDDPLLEQIWTIGRRTVRLCMDQAFMDCPWRERGQYVGDALVEARVARTMGDTTLARRFLRQAAFCQPADGLLDPAYPCDWQIWHGKRAPNRIAGYGALWIVLLAEHYRATGDLTLVRGLAGVLDRQLAWFDRFRGPAGFITSVPEWNFIDWAELEPASALACLNLQYVMALRAAAGLDAALGRKSVAAEEAAKLAAAFHQHCWDEKRGLYHDSKGVYTAHANALALLAVVEDGRIAARIAGGIRDAGVLQPATPYFESFVLRGLAKHGLHAEALRVVRQRWGMMVNAGATTFWEAFDSRASLCHGWSAEPVAFLAEEIAGATWDATRKVVRLAPHLVDLKDLRFKTTFAGGLASVDLKAFEGRILAEVKAEGGVEVDFPAQDGATLLVNGDRIAAQGSAGRIKTSLPGGSYTLEVAKP